VTTLAFLGPEGTFAHAALRDLSAAQGATLLPTANVTLAIDAVRAGDADGALVPLENSVEGAVPATLDELANGEALTITEETYLHVAFELMARPGMVAADVRTVATHPHAEAQVRRVPVVDQRGCCIGIIAQADVATRAGHDKQTGEVVEQISKSRATGK